MDKASFTHGKKTSLAKKREEAGENTKRTTEEPDGRGQVQTNQLRLRK